MVRSDQSALRKFPSDQGGSPAVEFAIVAPFFIGIIVAIFESLLAQYHISSLDWAVQKFAADMRSGAVMASDGATNITAAQIRDRIGPLLPGGMDASKLQIKLVNNTRCGAAIKCWQSQYSNYGNGVRQAPAFDSSSSLEFNLGIAGDSQYLTVYYPLPAMSSLWAGAPTATVNGEKVFGILSTAMWINDPSVNIFRATR
jgi:Flp pilus assembly protein TadG